MDIQEVKEKTEPGVKLINMPETKFSKIFIIESVKKDSVVVKLIDEGVGYEHKIESDSEVRREISFKMLSALLEADNKEGGWTFAD